MLAETSIANTRSDPARGAAHRLAAPLRAPPRRPPAARAPPAGASAPARRSPGRCWASSALGVRGPASWRSARPARVTRAPLEQRQHGQREPAPRATRRGEAQVHATGPHGVRNAQVAFESTPSASNAAANASRSGPQVTILAVDAWRAGARVRAGRSRRRCPRAWRRHPPGRTVPRCGSRSR